MPKNHPQVEWNSQIARDEVLIIKRLETLLARRIVDEDVEVLEDGNNDAECEGKIRAYDAERSYIRHLRVCDALGAASTHEADVSHKDGYPGEDSEDGDEIDEVIEDFSRGLGHVEEGDEGDAGGEAERVDRDATAISTGEDGWSVAFFREAVEGARGDVEVGIRGAEDKDKDAGVEEGWKDLDTGFDDGDYEGRGGGTGRLLGGEGEAGRVVGDEGTDEEDEDDVEEDDTPEGQLDGFGDDFAGVLGFADSDADELGAKVSKGRCDKGSPESEEAARVTGQEAFFEGTGVLPVSETLSSGRQSPGTKRSLSSQLIENSPSYHDPAHRPA